MSDGRGAIVTNAVERLVERYETEQIATLWGKPHTITPRVLPDALGDGRQLIGFTTTDARPAYWVVQVDSGWNLSNWASGDTVGEHVDEICNALDDHFGAGDCGYCGARYGSVEYAGTGEDGRTVWQRSGCDECRGEPEEDGLFPHFSYGAGVSWFALGDEARS